MHRSAQGRSKTPAHIPGDGKSIRQFFNRVANALTHGDRKTLGAMFTYPALAIANDMSKAITTSDEVEQYFGAASEQYKQRGIVDTRAEVRNIHWNSERIATVEVEWPYLDADGQQHGSESSTYVLHLDEHG